MDLALLEAVTANEDSGRKLYLDILEVATRLERNYGHFFKPYTGAQLYFDGISRPVLDFEKNTYYMNRFVDPLSAGAEDNTGETYQVPVRGFQDVVSADIFDSHDRLVVRLRDVMRLKIIPTDPIRMLDFVEAYVTDYCEQRIPVFEKSGLGFNKVLEKYLSDEFLVTYRGEDLAPRGPKESKSDYTHRKLAHAEDMRHFSNEIWYLMEPMMANIREFMGPNKWMIHTVRRVALDLVIESYLDYRIYIYHERLKEEKEKKEP